MRNAHPLRPGIAGLDAPGAHVHDAIDMPRDDERAGQFLRMVRSGGEDDTRGEQIAQLTMADINASPAQREAVIRAAALAVSGSRGHPVDREIKLGFIREMARLKPAHAIDSFDATPVWQARAIATVFQTLSPKDKATALKLLPDDGSRESVHKTSGFSHEPVRRPSTSSTDEGR